MSGLKLLSNDEDIAFGDALLDDGVGAGHAADGDGAALSVLAFEDVDEGAAVLFADGVGGCEENVLDLIDDDVGGGGEVGQEAVIGVEEFDFDGDGADIVLGAAGGGGEDADGADAGWVFGAGVAVEADAGGLADAELLDFGLVDGSFNLEGGGIDDAEDGGAGGEAVAGADGGLDAVVAVLVAEDDHTVDGGVDGQAADVTFVAGDVELLDVFGDFVDALGGGLGLHLVGEIGEGGVVLGLGLLEIEAESLGLDGGADGDALEVPAGLVYFGAGGVDGFEDVEKSDVEEGGLFVDEVRAVVEAVARVVEVVLGGLGVELGDDVAAADAGAGIGDADEGHGAAILRDGKAGGDDVGEDAGAEGALEADADLEVAAFDGDAAGGAEGLGLLLGGGVAGEGAVDPEAAGDGEDEDGEEREGDAAVRGRRGRSGLGFEDGQRMRQSGHGMETTRLQDFGLRNHVRGGPGLYTIVG